jgi:hypothetical protein
MRGESFKSEMTVDVKCVVSRTEIQYVRKVAVHLGYGTYIWLSVSKLQFKCAVISLYLVVKQRLNCITGKVCNCLIQFNSGSCLYRRSWTLFPTPPASAQ